MAFNGFQSGTSITYLFGSAGKESDKKYSWPSTYNAVIRSLASKSEQSFQQYARLLSETAKYRKLSDIIVTSL